jgi:hypothetical protein
LFGELVDALDGDVGTDCIVCAVGVETVLSLTGVGAKEFFRLQEKGE